MLILHLLDFGITNRLEEEVLALNTFFSKRVHHYSNTNNGNAVIHKHKVELDNQTLPTQVQTSFQHQPLIILILHERTLHPTLSSLA